MADVKGLAQALGLVIEDRGTAAATHDLAQLGVRAKDVRKVSQRIRTVYRKSERQRFNARGPGWPPLAESTVETKRRKGLDLRIMRARDTLADSLIKSRAPQQINERRPDGFRFGTRVRYAYYHEKGMGRLPVRDLINLTADDRKQIDNILMQFIVEGDT